MILIYIFIVFIIGLYKSRFLNNSDYLYASRSLTLTSFIATVVTTWYGGILEIGRFSYENGIVTWFIFGLFYYIAAIIFGIYIGPKLHDKNITSIPQYFKKYLGIIPEKISALLIFLICSPAPYIMILSTLLMHVFNISYHFSLLIGIFFSTGYIYFGGFKSILRTDKLQFVLMFSGFLSILIYLGYNYGGINFLLNNVPKENLSITGKLPIPYILSWSIIAMVTFIDPNLFQRAYASKNKRIIKKGIIISIIFWFIFDFLSISVAMYASAIFKTNNLISNPYLLLADSILPSPLKTLFYLSLFSIVMSTIDSFSFVSATTLSNDIFFDSKKIHQRTRLGLIITAVISYIIATNFKYAIDFWYVFGSISASSLLIPFIILLYSKNKIISYSEFSLTIPIIICCVWLYLNNPFGLDSIYAGLFSSLIINYFLWDKDLR